MSWKIFFPMFLGLLFCLLPAGVCADERVPRLEGMSVEYVEMPLAVDVSCPRFGWRMVGDSTVRGLRQVAYQLEVTDEHGTLVWNSGRVKDSRSQNIEYQGEALKPLTRYDWRVTVWDSEGRRLQQTSRFETSLLTTDGVEGWGGARWIGGGDDDRMFYSPYLPVFKLNLTFRLREGAASRKLAFVYGANDRRLMDANMNLGHLENGRDSSYIKVEFDLAPLDSGRAARLNVYRVGYAAADRADVPLRSFEIPLAVLDKSRMHALQCFTLYSDLGFTRFYKGDTLLGEENLNPLGRGGDFIAFPVVGDVGFSVGPPTDLEEANIEICNYRSPENRLALVKMEQERLEQSAHGYYLVNPSRNAAPMLRTEFSTRRAKLSKARLCVTARGIYEIYLNGQRVGNDYFNPGMTQYNKTHLYQIYDVTSLLAEGRNALGAILAEGWWSGGATYTGENWNFFGDRQSLLAQLVLTYDDGTEQRIVTSPDTWKCFTGGPVIYGSFFQGEVYDATREKAVEGWARAGYDDSAWLPAVEVATVGNVSTVGGGNTPRVDDYSRFQLVAQYGQTVKAVRKLTARSVEEVRPGVFVYDMGQNMAGVPEITLEGMEPGRKICLRFAEVKYPDLPRYAGNTGLIMLENIRAAMAQDLYTTRGGRETIAPRFTFHGYRYVEITGIDRALPVEAVRGVVLSSVDRLTSHYETSNEKVNRLWQNIVWSTYANFLSIPTDCPQRNERMGWAGDISVFSRTSTYLTDAGQFLRRYLRAMRDVQREDGRFPDVAPMGVGFGGLLWGSAGITVPWEVYRQYGDRALLAEHYEAMCRYIDYVLAKNIDPQTGVLVQEKVWGNLGDWLGPEDNKNDKTLMWEAYFLYDLEIMSKVAALLGREVDAERFRSLYKERLDFFRRIYICPETGKTIASGADGPAKGQAVDIQTSYVLPLAFGLVEDSLKTRFAANLAHTVSRANVADNGRQCPPYSLMTGFIGTAWICKALSDGGYDDVAYRLLQQTSYPSWLYSVEQGATTIWERLDSYTHTDGFGENNRMNSFNHYSFGAVGAWMYGYSLGIQCDEASPGFHHFVLRPTPDPTGQMKYAKGYYDSLYGRIRSEWRLADDGSVHYSFSIPANTTATLYLRADSADSLTEGGRKLRPGSCGVEQLTCRDGWVILELQSGTYSFVKHE